MSISEAIFLFIIGSVFGSFISLLSYRLPNGQNIIWARSACPNCKKNLSIKDLIPIFSYLMSKGECNYCFASISYRYILIELFTGLVFIINYTQVNDYYTYIYLSIITVIFITIIVIDVEQMIIPDSLQISLIIIGVLNIIYINKVYLSSQLINALVFFLIAYAIKFSFQYFAKKEGLGFGDVKLIGVAGLYLDFNKLALFLFLAGILGVISSIIWQNLMRLGKNFPFAPSLVISLYLCIINERVIEITDYYEVFIINLVNRILY